MPNSSSGSNPIKQSVSEENVPYVGPRPFTLADRDIFFGRKQEAIELTSLVKAHSETLLFAPSGAGKTSLLYAQVLPILYHEEEFDVLKAARVRSQESATIPEAKISNIYMFNALKDLSDDQLSLIERAQLTLAEYLERRPWPLLEQEDLDSADEQPERRLARVIVFDQFEEIFTLYPERYKDRQNFFSQVADALKADPFLRVVFSMREDYIAELEPYSGVLPQGLRSKYRLERLRKANALSAVEEPLKTERVKTHRHFDDGAAELLVKRLMLIKVKTGSGEKIEVPGEFVDPVQLQVVCQTLWEKLPPEKVIITKQDIDKYANVDEALLDFYQNCVRKAVAAVSVIQAANNQDASAMITEGLVRGWFEQKLITREGKRNMILRERDAAAGLSNVVVDELENQHVIRVEMRGGEPWYELSHDRFIPPIRESNRRFLLQQPLAKRKAEELEARAGEWLQSRRSEKLLLNRGELADAQNWMSTEAAAIGHSETLFSLIQASEAAIEHEDNKQQQLLAEARERRMIAERQRTRQLKMGFVMASVLLALAVVSWFSAYRSEARARTALAEATTAQVKEKQERQNAETAANNLALEKEKVEKEKKEAQAARKRAEVAKNFADLKKREADAARAKSETVVEQLDWLSRVLARSRNNAWSLKLAADANSVINDDPEKSLTLALLAVDKAETEQAKDVVGRAFLKRKDRGILRGHTDKVWSAIYGPNGQIFTMSEDGTVGIWNPEKSENVKMLPGPNPVHAFAISLDGNWLATEELNEVGRIWNLRDGTSKEVGGLSGPVAALALSPNGKLLVTEANDKEEKPGSSPRIWEVSTGQRLHTLKGHSDAVCSIAFSPSGSQIATASWDGTARLWDAESGRSLTVLQGHTAPLTSIEFDSSGELVVTSSFDGTARVWNVSTGKEQAVLRGHTGVVNSAVFSPDDKLILTAGREVSDRVKMVPQQVPLPEELRTRVGTPDTSARLWDARTGRLIDILKGHTGDVNSAVFSSDGNLVLTAGEDGLVLVWSTDSGTVVNKLQGHNGPVNTAVFSPNISSVLTASEDKTAQTWRWKHDGWGEFAAHDRQVIRTTVNDDGSIVTAGLNGSLRQWTINNDLKVDRVRGGAEVDLASLNKSPKEDAPPPRVRDLALSPKGDVVVTASVIPVRTRYRPNAEDADKNAHVWNVKSQKFDRELTGHKEPVTQVLFSSSGAYVATLSKKQLQLWDTSTWKSIPFEIDSSLVDAAFSPDEQVLFMIQSDGRLSTTNLKKVETKFIKVARSLSRAVFNLQANRVAAAVSDDMVGVWDMDGIRKSTVKASDALKVAFSPDSALLLTAGLDSRIQVWKTETGEPVTETDRFDFPLTSLAFDRRLSSLLIGDALGKVHVIECELCRPFDQIKKMAIESHPRPLTPAELREYLPEEKP